MFFQVYGANALSQWIMLIVVLVGLILFNEFACHFLIILLHFIISYALEVIEMFVPTQGDTV